MHNSIEKCIFAADFVGKVTWLLVDNVGKVTLGCAKGRDGVEKDFYVRNLESSTLDATHLDSANLEGTFAT